MSQQLDDTYKELIAKTREISLIFSCLAVLDWDHKTYMPKKGAEIRSQQISMLAGMGHKKFIDPHIGELINKLKDGGYAKKEFTVEETNIRELSRQYDKFVKVPTSLIEELSKTTTLADAAWIEARKKSDYNEFKPWLDKVIKLKQQYAEAVGYENEPYDALLDDYEPGATAKTVAKVLEDFRVDLVEFVGKVLDSGKKPDVSILEREYPVDLQEVFGKMAAAAMGFDFEGGRLDVTTHPFCTGFGPGDTRITTRYNLNHFNHAFFGIMHEAGHGIYDQGLPAEHTGTPMGESVSLGIHESQSRMWENMVGRSRPFWNYFFPLAQRVFQKSLADVKLDDFYFAANDVQPSFIRVEADEVTYNLHILVRFEMEHAFFKGDLKVDDIPAVWNEKFKHYLGITPDNDANGCLQDVHWSNGLIGYFPTYTLGNLYAAQFYAKAEKDIGPLDKQFERGEYLKLKKWLNENIHIHGQKYRAEKLVQVVTGNKFSHKPFMEYLKAKFGPLYGVK
ncbi:MAG: carboxypeptidase M32 [candidate division Zixibacteria bacterium]|nr:carboxypeptidase M32 [candidate division Zixibacteria bacterium]